MFRSISLGNAHRSIIDNTAQETNVAEDQLCHHDTLLLLLIGRQRSVQRRRLHQVLILDCHEDGNHHKDDTLEEHNRAKRANPLVILCRRPRLDTLLAFGLGHHLINDNRARNRAGDRDDERNGRQDEDTHLVVQKVASLANHDTRRSSGQGNRLGNTLTVCLNGSVCLLLGGLVLGILDLGQCIDRGNHDSSRNQKHRHKGSNGYLERRQAAHKGANLGSHVRDVHLEKVIVVCYHDLYKLFSAYLLYEFSEWPTNPSLYFRFSHASPFSIGSRALTVHFLFLSHPHFLCSLPPCIGSCSRMNTRLSNCMPGPSLTLHFYLFYDVCGYSVSCGPRSILSWHIRCWRICCQSLSS